MELRITKTAVIFVTFAGVVSFFVALVSWLMMSEFALARTLAAIFWLMTAFLYFEVYRKQLTMRRN